MGEYFRIVNPSKIQYLDPINFGENIKRNGVLRGNHGLALACLVCRGVGAGPPFGSWAGDEVFVAGDESPPDEWGIPTRTPERPDRNLYLMATDDYEDISCKAIVMLCEFDPSLVEEFIGRANVSGRLLLSLGNIVYQLKYKPIEMALIKTIGKGWAKQLAEEERKRLRWGRPSS